MTSRGESTRSIEHSDPQVTEKRADRVTRVPSPTWIRANRMIKPIDFGNVLISPSSEKIGQAEHKKQIRDDRPRMRHTTATDEGRTSS